MAEYTPTTETVEAFKAAWHEADAEGDEGNRVSRGLAAALAQHDAAPRAEVERLRAQMSALSAHAGRLEEEHDEARQQVADLRAGIEALRRQWEGEVLTGHGARREGLRKALDDLAALAVSGEQPGEGGPPHLAHEWAALTAQQRAEVFAWFTRPLLAAVGQGVTDCNCGFGGQRDPANPRCRANRATEKEAPDDR